jgi:voltage-gated potassium channel
MDNVFIERVWRSLKYEEVHLKGLRRARRSATVRATTRTNLLVLDASDFHVLMEQEPRIAERVHTVVRDRIGREIVTPRGDMVTEEIATPEE